MDIKPFKSIRAEFTDTVWITCTITDPQEAERFLGSHVSIRYLDSERGKVHEYFLDEPSPSERFQSVRSLRAAESKYDGVIRVVLEPRRMLPMTPEKLHLIVRDGQDCFSRIDVGDDSFREEKMRIAREIIAEQKNRPVK